MLIKGKKYRVKPNSGHWRSGEIVVAIETDEHDAYCVLEKDYEPELSLEDYKIRTRLIRPIIFEESCMEEVEEVV